ncbi:MAG: preprotein translocase subunit SecG [Gemmatimonadales bacterium]
MLYTFLLILLIIDSFVLIAAVLFQAGQGGGLADSFGGVSSSASSFLGTRQTGNLLTKASWWCGGLFLALSFLLSLASTRSRAPKSVLDQTFQTPAPITAPATTPGGASPAIPLTPVNPAPTTAPNGGAKTAPTGTGAKKPPATTTPAPKKP